MHITDETTYLDVGRAYMEGSSLRGEGEFRLLVGSKSVLWHNVPSGDDYCDAYETWRLS